MAVLTPEFRIAAFVEGLPAAGRRANALAVLVCPPKPWRRRVNTADSVNAAIFQNN